MQVADRDRAWTFELDPLRQSEPVRLLPARDSFLAQGDLVSPVHVTGATVLAASVTGSMVTVPGGGSGVTNERVIRTE